MDPKPALRFGPSWLALCHGAVALVLATSLRRAWGDVGFVLGLAAPAVSFALAMQWRVEPAADGLTVCTPWGRRHHLYSALVAVVRGRVWGLRDRGVTGSEAVTFDFGDEGAVRLSHHAWHDLAGIVDAATAVLAARASARLDSGDEVVLDPGRVDLRRPLGAFVAGLAACTVSFVLPVSGLTRTAPFPLFALGLVLGWVGAQQLVEGARRRREPRLALSRAGLRVLGDGDAGAAQGHYRSAGAAHPDTVPWASLADVSRSIEGLTLTLADGRVVRLTRRHAALALASALVFDRYAQTPREAARA